MMLLLLNLLVAPCKPLTNHACTCLLGADPETVAETRQRLAEIDVVFAGRVLHTRYGRDSTRVLSGDGTAFWFPSNVLVATMAVEEVWKGPVADTVQVETNVETSACGARLQVDESYLISASLVDESLITSKCSWTRPLLKANRLQALLRRATSRAVGDLKR